MLTERMSPGGRGGTDIERWYGDVQPSRPPFHALPAAPKTPISSAGFTTGPVGPGPRARDPGGPKIMRAKKKKKKRKRKRKKKEKTKEKGSKGKRIKCRSTIICEIMLPLIIENLRGISFFYLFCFNSIYSKEHL